MRSERSSKEMSTIIKTDIKRFWALPLIATLILLLSGPFVLLMIDEYFDGDVPFANNNNVGFMFAYILLGTGLGILLFNYMVSKKSSGYFHSLPITRGQHFVANYVAGMIMIAVPLIVNGLAMTAVFGFKYIGSYALMTIMAYLITMVMYSITVFAATISGNVVMHLFSAGFFNGLALMVLLVIATYMNSLLYGYSVSEFLWEMIKSSLPIFAFRNGVSGVPLIVYLCVVVLATVLAYLVYKRRPMENAGDSLVFGWTKSLMLGITSFLGALLMGQAVYGLIDSSQGGFKISMFIGLLIGFVITFIVMAVIIDKGTKIFNKRNGIAFVATGIALILSVGILATDVLGYGSYKPKAEKVDCVYIGMDMSDNSMQYQRMNPENFNCKYHSFGDRKNLLKLEGSDNIKAACEIQRQFAERKAWESGELSFLGAYESNGKKTVRYYEMDEEKDTYKAVKPYIKEIFESDEVKEKMSLKNLKIKITGITVTEDDSEKAIHSERKYDDNRRFEGLLNALDKDFKNMTYEEYLASYHYADDNAPSITINYKNNKKSKYYEEDYYLEGMDIKLSKAYKNTNKWLKENM